MNVEDFRTLYDYNSWANRRTLDACGPLTPEQFARDLGSSFRSVRDTLAHIYGAEWIWLERWHGRLPSSLPSPSDFPDLETIQRSLHDVDGTLVSYVTSLDAAGVSRVVEFKSLAGVPYAQPLAQCLQHVANHSTYHRGQIATLLRQLGTKAVSTDLIAFYRERAGQGTA
jgi:uncharacterized damage-inducible protein DinB